MVKPVTFTPLPKESEVHPELTGLDQLTPEERERIQTRMAPPAAPAPEMVPAPAEPPADEFADHYPAVAQLLDASTRDVEMTRRSWYVSKAASDALADAVDEIHHATRGLPKHVIASLLFEMAAANAQPLADQMRQLHEQQRATRITRSTSATSHS